jgi:hypothetical protein
VGLLVRAVLELHQALAAHLYPTLAGVAVAFNLVQLLVLAVLEVAVLVV